MAVGISFAQEGPRSDVNAARDTISFRHSLRGDRGNQIAAPVLADSRIRQEVEKARGYTRKIAGKIRLRPGGEIEQPAVLKRTAGAGIALLDHLSRAQFNWGLRAG